LVSPSKDERGEEFTSFSLVETVNTPENRRTTYTKKGRKGKKKTEKENVEEELTTSGRKGKKKAEKENVEEEFTTSEGQEFTSFSLIETVNTPEDKKNRRVTYTKKGRKGKKKVEKENVEEEHELTTSGWKAKKSTEKEVIEEQVQKLIPKASIPVVEEFLSSIPEEVSEASGESENRRQTFTKQASAATLVPIRRQGTFDKTPTVSQEVPDSSPWTRLRDFSARETKFSIGTSPARKSSVTPLKSVTLKGRTPDLRTSAIKPAAFRPRTASKTPMKVNPTVAKTPITNKIKAPTPFSSAKRKLGSMPDFKKIHQRQVEKMENIVDYKKRTAARGLNLLSPVTVKPSRSLSMIPRPINGSFRASTASPGSPFLRFGKPSDIKNPPTSTEKIREKKRELLKGVRMNKRFMLQMQMRKLV